MRAIFAPIAATALMLAALPTYAYANVTYNFIEQTASAIVNGSLSEPGPPPGTILGSFTVTDAVVEAGSMNFYASASCSDCFSRDFPSYFLNYRFLYGPGSDDNGYAYVTFNPDGTLSGKIDLSDQYGGFTSTGTERAWTGVEAADDPGSFNATGYWIDPQPLPVPEPSSLAIMLSAIGATIGVGLRRSRA
jgi:hypothetical protein